MQKMKRMIAGALMVSVFALSGVFSNITFAASLTSLSDNMSRLAENTASNHEIKFVTPSGVSAGQNITITFSSDFTGVASIAHGDVDFAEGNSNNCTTASFTEKTLAATASGSTWGAAGSGQVVTITSGTDTVTPDRCVRIRIGTNATSQTTGTNQITNGAADDDDTITIAGTFGDSGTISVDIIPDDQVVITATVDPSITFSISDNTIGFGNLSAASARYATGDTNGTGSETTAHNLAAGTNATGGYVIYVSGPTLTSGPNSIDAIGDTNTGSTPGTEQFGMRFESSGGSGTVTAPYAASGFAYNGVSAPDQIASASGATSTTTYTARYLANIAADTEAGSYSTTLTYTATASF